MESCRLSILDDLDRETRDRIWRWLQSDDPLELGPRLDERYGPMLEKMCVIEDIVSGGI